MKFKRIFSLVLLTCLSLSLLSGCGKEPEPVNNVEAPPSYVFGEAGDMVRSFMNLVSQQDWETIREYMWYNENAIITLDDMKASIMASQIGNIIGMGYQTKNIVTSTTGDFRTVTFTYSPDAGGEVACDVLVKLIGTKWKIYLEKLLAEPWTIEVPSGYSLSIDGVEVSSKTDVYEKTETEDGYDSYLIPQISVTEKKILMKDAQGNEYTDKVKPQGYTTTSGGKVTCTGVYRVEPKLVEKEGSNNEGKDNDVIASPSPETENKDATVPETNTDKISDNLELDKEVDNTTPKDVTPPTPEENVDTPQPNPTSKTN